MGTAVRRHVRYVVFRSTGPTRLRCRCLPQVPPLARYLWSYFGPGLGPSFPLQCMVPGLRPPWTSTCTPCPMDRVVPSTDLGLPAGVPVSSVSPESRAEGKTDATSTSTTGPVPLKLPLRKVRSGPLTLCVFNSQGTYH